MKPGSVIVDIAADAGGNCALTKPGEDGDDAERGARPGIHQLARPHPRRVLRALCPEPAHLPDDVLGHEAGAPKLPPEDEIVRGVMLTRGGQVVHPSLAQQAKAA